ncbi:RND family transporter [Mycolicibacterium rhodesiae]|uniref:Membrane transport protein MMPL domain-containing protein n=1 Tax=Mycolicibacterium rhodesiae TaxID=36814 RepID=A0A1X0IM93_MYCRH|nr:RND family transporter [Mycolicibacterium rhodesiae]MCV7347626.1 RND family transporter [Mycolicibacterium rhodesiae]ORB49260.1 hypothetical protein BST42_23735 [Mycolicibacterium rhodesiae]
MRNQPVNTRPPTIAHNIRRFSVLVILGWLAIIVGLTIGVPTLEQVEAENATSQNSIDAPSFTASQRISEAFQADTSDGDNPDKKPGPRIGGAPAMVVLEGQQPLDDAARQYYDSLIRQFRADTLHVQHIQDFWGDPLTSAAAQSADGKAVYVQLSLTGTSGAAPTNESVQAVRDIVAKTPAPPGLSTYVTGPTALAADFNKSGNSTVTTITLVSLAVIFVTLLLIYRSPVTVILLLLIVGIQLQAARGFVALLGHYGIIGLNTLAVNLLVALVIAAGTDYGIFFIGRYHEARLAGEDQETAYYTTYRSVAKVVLATGLTVSGATLCLHLTRLPAFQALGIPCAIGIAVAVAVALTLVPAVIAVGSRFGIFEPKRNSNARGWRRIGTAVVRWPAPILVASLAVTLVGLLTLPGFSPDYNDQHFLPRKLPATQGIAAAERHFPPSAMMSPEILMIQTDHDLRNSADFLVLNKLAKAVLAVPGIEKVQAATRPAGNPVAHSTIPYMLSIQQSGQQQFMIFQQNRADDMLKQADQLSKTIAITERIYDLTKQTTELTHKTVLNAHEAQDLTHQIRDQIAVLDDFIRPIRNYLYWEPHCFDIPVCWAVRNVLDALDSADLISDNLQKLIVNLDQMDLLLPQILTQFPETLAILKSSRDMLLTSHSTMAGTLNLMSDQGSDPSAMGRAFDTAQNDDSFYLGPETFKNPDFQRIMKIFLSSDGKATRMLISQKGDPTSPEGIARVDAIKTAAEEALKGTPLEGSQIFLAGTAAQVKDVVIGTKYDMMIAIVAALCLIFIVMVIMTRSLIAAIVIVGTILLSLGASFGLSVLVWQYLLHIELHWSVLVMTVIILLAVGSDYNLLLVARIREELAAGVNTGIIRAMAGTGKVVTTAGLVFAFTMASMIVSDVISIGQVGMSIAVGLLFDTLLVRAFMTPSIAALLGRWFWWPQVVRPRPASTMLRPTGPRPLVRALLLTPEKK